MQAIVVQGIDQGPQHVLLPDHLLELLRPPFAGQNGIAHGAVRDCGRGWLMRIETPGRQSCDCCPQGLARRPRTMQKKSGGPRQLHPGARSYRYRCSLPGLAGFAACRRGGLTEDTIELDQPEPERTSVTRWSTDTGNVETGGEGGIRTLDTLPYTHFPGVLLQPLGHLSANHADHCLPTDLAAFSRAIATAPEKRSLRVSERRRRVHKIRASGQHRGIHPGLNASPA
jgi:hypothetical protein